MDKRVRQACARCRRQKLKCDDTRPCQLCIRSKVECVQATEKTNRSNRKQQAKLRQSSASVLDESPKVYSTKYAQKDEDDTGTWSHETHESAPDQERSSTYSIVEKLFHGQSSQPGRSDALPGGSPSADHHVPPLLRVEGILGVTLPPASIIHVLLDTYMRTFHWYITLFHEPLFRQHLDPIVSSGLAHQSQKPFLLLLLAIFLNSVQFCDEDALLRACPGYDRHIAETSWLQAIEQNIFSCFDDLQTPFIGCLFIMSMIYLQRKKTPLALSLVATMVRAAQALNLYKEHTWGPMDNSERQIRRMIWWSVFMSDGYSSQAYGKPSLLHKRDIHVAMPLEIDDHFPSCPGFGTLELKSDGQMRPVTTLSYNRHKTELYLITSPLTENMSFRTGQAPDHAIDQLKQIHRQLLQWESQLPAELRAATFASHSASLQHDPVVRIFALQAFTLQAAYENMQLLLHRPFIPMPSSLRPSSLAKEAQDNVALLVRHKEDLMITSRDQCWISAMRMTDVDFVPGLLQVLEKTTPYTQWVSYVFNGGVMLAMLALTNIRSNRTLLCKQALARLIKTLQRGTTKLEMCDQVCRILTRLLHLVATEEVKAMLGAEGEPGCDKSLFIPEYGCPDIRDIPTRLTVHERLRQDTASAPDTSTVATVAHHGYSPTDAPEPFDWDGEFGLGGIGHLWMWNDSYSISSQT